MTLTQGYYGFSLDFLVPNIFSVCSICITPYSAQIFFLVRQGDITLIQSQNFKVKVTVDIYDVFLSMSLFSR